MAGNIFRALKNVGFFKDTWNNVYSTILGKKFRDLSKKDYTVNPDINDTQTFTPEKTNADAGAIVKPEGEPKQDLEGKQTEGTVDFVPQKVDENLSSAPIIPERRPEGAGGDLTKVKTTGNYITTGNQPKNYGLEGLYNKEVALKNKMLQNDVLNFIAYASKFGDAGAGYINQAMNMLYPMKFQQKQQEKPFNKESYMRGPNGELLQMVYDFEKLQHVPIAVTKPDGKPMMYDEMFYKEPKIEWIPFEKDGKVSYINPYSQETKDTEIDWWSYNENPIVKAKIDADMQETLLKINAQGNGNSGNRGNSGDGDDDGTTSSGTYPDFIEQGMGKEPWKNMPIILDENGQVMNQKANEGYKEMYEALTSPKREKRRQAYNYFRMKNWKVQSKENYEYPDEYDDWGHKKKKQKQTSTKTEKPKSEEQKAIDNKVVSLRLLFNQGLISEEDYYKYLQGFGVVK